MKTNRRNFFQTAGLGAAGLGIASALPLTSCATTAKAESETDEQVLLVGDDIAIAQTVYGKVQGFILRGKGAELSGLTFNCSKVAAEILDLKKVEKSASFQISKQPMLINGLEYWPIITARLLSIK